MYFEQKHWVQDNLVQINFVLSAAILTPSEKDNSRKFEKTTLVIMKALQNSTPPTFRIKFERCDFGINCKGKYCTHFRIDK